MPREDLGAQGNKGSQNAWGAQNAEAYPPDAYRQETDTMRAGTLGAGGGTAWSPGGLAARRRGALCNT